MTALPKHHPTFPDSLPFLFGSELGRVHSQILDIERLIHRGSGTYRQCCAVPLKVAIKGPVGDIN
jgi:hypothetical protein